MSVRETSNKKLTDWQRNLQCDLWQFRKSVLIRPIPAIHADLVDLAIDVVLTIVGVLPIVANSTMSLTRTTTTAPVFHRYDSIVGILLGVESVIANQWVFVGIFVVEECRRFLVLVGGPSLHGGPRAQATGKMENLRPSDWTSIL